jgi:hypothetical protein
MKSLWQHDARLTILRRIDSVQAGTTPLWGRMSAERMMRHLAQSMSMANAELPVKSKKVPLRFFPLKQLGVYVLPMPKGLPTAPELLEGDDSSIEIAREDLHRAIESFMRCTVFPEHPVFGTLTKRAWGVLTYKHIDHHLRQFGA